MPKKPQPANLLSLTIGMLPFLGWIRQITPGSLRADVFAAFTNAAIALPQGIAFAAIAGLPAEYGLYTAMVTPVIAALFGSSWHMVSGPTTAISVVIFVTLSGQFVPGSPEYIGAVLAITLLAGLFQLILGLVNLGQLVSLVSHSVMVGFTAGAAVLIGLSQIAGFIGADLPRPEDLVAFLEALVAALPNLEPMVIAISLWTLLTAVVIKRFLPSWPNYLLALIAGGVFAYLMDAGSRGVEFVHPVSSGIPPFAVPALSFDSVRTMSQGALALALIGLLEAVSIARAMAIKSGQTVNSNQEIIGQGFSNIGGSFFGAYMGSGSFTRSALNFESGARTPMAAILAAVFLLGILLLIAPLISYIPLPAMAALIMLVAWRLVDVKEIRHIVRSNASETAILLTTFLAVLFVDLEFAIYSGVILSLAMFVRRTMHPGLPINVPNANVPGRPFMSSTHWRLPECPQAFFIRVQGPLYFGAVEYLEKEFRKFEQERPEQRHLVLFIDGSVGIDLAGSELLVQEAKRREDLGGQLYLVGRYPPLRRQLARFHIPRLIGRKHIFRRKTHAVEALVRNVDPAICAKCELRVFLECPDAEEALARVKSEAASQFTK